MNKQPDIDITDPETRRRLTKLWHYLSDSSQLYPGSPMPRWMVFTDLGYRSLGYLGCDLEFLESHGLIALDRYPHYPDHIELLVPLFTMKQEGIILKEAPYAKA